jgi:hypothetical protein
MLWEKLRQPWEWLFVQLGNPGVVQSLALLAILAAIALFVLSRIVRWLVDRHLEDATNHLFAKHEMRFRARGIPRAPLTLIAKCIAWVCGMKLVAEMFEPFASVTVPALSERNYWTTTYDWLVFVAIVLLALAFWVRFHLDVRHHDASKPNSKIERGRWRTIPLFWKPAVAFLFLAFLPDLGKRAASLGADYFKLASASLALAEPDNPTPTLDRHYGGGLRVTLAPNQRNGQEKPR